MSHFMCVSGKDRIHISSDIHGGMRYEDHSVRFRHAPRLVSPERLEFARLYYRCYWVNIYL